LTTWLVTLPGIFMVAYLGYLGASAVADVNGAVPVSGWQWLARGLGLLVAAAAVFYVGRIVRKALKDPAALALSEAERESAVAPEPMQERVRPVVNPVSPWWRYLRRSCS
jgi:hypothetical protein